MKVFKLAALLVAICAMVFVGGCRKRHWTHEVTTLDTNTYTPQHLTVVDISDPCNYLKDGKVSKARLLADLDYQILYFWYFKELNEEGHADFDSYGLQGYAHSVNFHLVVADRFEVETSNGTRHVSFAIIGDDIYLASGVSFLHENDPGCTPRRLFRNADRSMDLFTNDTHDRDDNADPAYLPPGTEPEFGNYLVTFP